MYRERRIIRRDTPNKVGVIVVVIATLNHTRIVRDHHIHVTVVYTFGTVHPLDTYNVTIIYFRLHGCSRNREIEFSTLHWNGDILRWFLAKLVNIVTETGRNRQLQSHECPPDVLRSCPAA